MTRGSRVDAIAPSVAVSIAIITAAVTVCHGPDGPFVSQHTLALALVELERSCLAPLFIGISVTAATAAAAATTALLILVPLALLMVVLVLVLFKILMTPPTNRLVARPWCAGLLRLGGRRDDLCSSRVLHPGGYGLSLRSRCRPPGYSRSSAPSRFQGFELTANMVCRDVYVDFAPVTVALLASCLLMLMMMMMMMPSLVLFALLLMLPILLFLAYA